MPLMYHGFIPAALLIMAVCLLLRQLWQLLVEDEGKRKIS